MASVVCNRVIVKFGDREFTGHYSIGSGTITVNCGDQQETAKIGNLPPELKARMLLRELAIKAMQEESLETPSPSLAASAETL